MIPARTVRKASALLAGAIAVALLGAVTLAGCAASPSGNTKTPAPSSSKTPAAPTPTPTPTFAALDYTCESILPPGTLTAFQAKASAGFALQTDYLLRMENIGSRLVDFNQYGGILCQWAYPDASKQINYAFSAITSDQAASEQTTLASAGYVSSQKYHGTLYANTDTADYPDEYLFLDGYWIQASTDDVMQLLVDNVFVTS